MKRWQLTATNKRHLSPQIQHRGRLFFGKVTGKLVGYRWINEEILTGGWAWHDQRYSDDDFLDTAEEQVRAKCAGLWGGTKPVPPWEWRQRHPAVAPEDAEPENEA